LLADVKAVPRRFAELIKAGAYTGRSVELSRLTSQRTGKRYDLVVSGLAWLGDKLPAVQTLDDVVALYEGQTELVRAYQLDAVDAIEAELATVFPHYEPRAHDAGSERNLEAQLEEAFPGYEPRQEVA
jgi:hypothetical protein